MKSRISNSIIFIQFIIFLYTIPSLFINHFLLKNCSLHFISKNFNNICIASSTMPTSGHIPFSNPFFVPLNFLIQVLNQCSPLLVPCTTNYEFFSCPFLFHIAKKKLFTSSLQTDSVILYTAHLTFFTHSITVFLNWSLNFFASYQILNCLSPIQSTPLLVLHCPSAEFFANISQQDTISCPSYYLFPATPFTAKPGIPKNFLLGSPMNFRRPLVQSQYFWSIH